MKVSKFYSVFYRRQNIIKQLLLGLFFAWSSWPRLLLEVFLRHKMGERYFSLMSVFVVFGFLCYVAKVENFGASAGGLLWYAFTLAFLLAGLYRKWEIWQLGPDYDFDQFSLSTGEFWPWLTNLRFQGKPLLYKGQPIVISEKYIQILVEPALFFLPGVVLWALEQPLGFLLMGSSVVYSLSYVASYQMGRDFVLDQIDQAICSESLGSMMNEGLAPEPGQGVRFPGDLPTDPEQLRRLAPAFLDEDVAYPIR